MSYITPSQLSAALNRVTYLALFDQDNLGYVSDDDESVQLVLSRSAARVRARLPAAYATLSVEVPATTDALLVDAQLLYAQHYSYLLHPEYVRTVGQVNAKTKTFWDMGQETMDAFQAAILRLVTVAPVVKPANVGGIVYASGPMLLTNADGSSGFGDL